MVEWLDTIPPAVIYLVVSLVIGLESVGIPLPGEIMLVSAGVVASQGVVDPVLLGSFAAVGAIIGDSVGYAVGRRYGRSLLSWLGRKMPKHFGPKQIRKAERAFDHWGAWAVFGGRFVALLRILAGPLAGILGMRYWKFLLANTAGGILWAGAVTTVAYTFGLVAAKWLHRFSWVGLILALVVGWLITRYVHRHADEEDDIETDKAADSSKADVSN